MFSTISSTFEILVQIFHGINHSKMWIFARQIVKTLKHSIVLCQPISRVAKLVLGQQRKLQSSNANSSVDIDILRSRIPLLTGPSSLQAVN